VSLVTRADLTCVVADNHPAVVDAVARALRGAGVDVVGEAGDGETAFALVERLAPAVALLDLRMPGIGGLEVTRRIRDGGLATAIILYTAYGDHAALADAFAAGAAGYVLKDAPLDDLVRAIEIVARGKVYLDPELAAWAAGGSHDARRLTARERDVLRLLAQGRRNDEIARELFIAPTTVRSHIDSATAKLHARTRTEAVAIAVREALIT
jgi:DNA-binding NarL/FixJ family response regulator